MEEGAKESRRNYSSILLRRGTEQGKKMEEREREEEEEKKSLKSECDNWISKWLEFIFSI